MAPLVGVGQEGTRVPTLMVSSRAVCHSGIIYMWSALSFPELIFTALEGAVDEAQAMETCCIEELEESAATRFINGIRLARVQNICMVVSAFGILEAEIQRVKGYGKPFSELINEFRTGDNKDLADRIEIFVKAINTLKHGYGKSHDYLLRYREDLSFDVKERFEDFFLEGDISEVPTLIDITSQFLNGFLESMKEITRAIDDNGYVYDHPIN